MFLFGSFFETVQVGWEGFTFHVSIKYKAHIDLDIDNPSVMRGVKRSTNILGSYTEFEF